MYSVQSLADDMLERMLSHPRFLDIAMRRVGSRIEYEHVRYLRYYKSYQYCTGFNDEGY